MKNYCYDEKSREFIESYEIVQTQVGNSLVLSLGSGEKYTIPLTEKNLKIIENIMYCQFVEAQSKVSDLSKKRKKYKKAKKIFKFLSIFIVVLAILGIPMANYFTKAYLESSIDIFALVDLPLIITSCYLSISTFAKSRDYRLKAQHLDIMLDDIEKHDIYYNIKDKVRTYLSLGNKNLEADIPSEVVEIINPKEKRTVSTKSPSISRDKEITLNMVHNMSLRDLKILRNNIRRIEHFGFEGDSVAPKTQNSDKAKTMVMSPKNPIN